MTLTPAQRTIAELAEQSLAAATSAQARLDWRRTPEDLARAASEPLRAPEAPPAPEEEIEADHLALKRARPITARLKNPNARSAFRRLLIVMFEIARRKGYNLHTTEITVHIPSEIVMRHLMVSRTTLWRYVKAWKRLGILDARGHVTTCHGQRVMDGTLWTVRLRFNHGKRARVRYEDLNHQGWRDLTADIQRGRTAWRQVKQSYRRREEPAVNEWILQWALPPGQLQAPLPLTVSPPHQTASSTSILDLRSVSRGDRGRLVDAAAHAIARELNDHHSLNYHRWILWQLLRLLDTGTDLLDTLLLQVQRAKADRAEGFARRAGALLHKRLRDSGILEIIQHAPRNRVGTTPAR